MRIEIWSDVVCPWCYVASARFDKALAGFPHRDQVEVVHRSFELDPGHDGSHTEPVTRFLTARFGPQGPAMDEHVAALARRERLRYRTDRLVGSTLDAHRLLHLAKEEGRQHELLNVLFEANFAEAETIFTHDALLELAVKAGLDRVRAAGVLADTEAYLDAVREDESEAARAGARGVPFFAFSRRHGLSGAQTVETFAEALQSAWDEQYPGDFAAPTAVCGPDGTCALPIPHDSAGVGSVGTAR